MNDQTICIDTVISQSINMHALNSIYECAGTCHTAVNNIMALKWLLLFEL